MRPKPLSLAALVALLALALWSPPEAAAATCGTDGQPPCYSLWNLVNAGKIAAADAGALCPNGGAFYPLVEGGTCWSCPGDSVNFPPLDVTSQEACGFFGLPTAKAQQHQQVGFFEACPGTLFRDAPCVGCGIYCWSCPDGYIRNAEPITSDKSCTKIDIGLKPAISHGKGIVGCREGLADIRGTCRKLNDCGKQGQRPCLVGERLPSCDEGLKEDFKRNECVALRPGESPFLGGVASLSEYIGESIEGQCRAWLGSIELPGGASSQVGPECGRYIGVGFSCALLRELSQASYADKVQMLLDLPYQVSTAIGETYRSGACSQFDEHLDAAIKHGPANGLDCPAGQFWDPNGNCYSCPGESQRTLYPVDGPRACVNQFGGELLKVGCSIATAVEQKFAAPLDCTIQALENGSFFATPLDLDHANAEVCMATGKLGFTIVAAGADIGVAAATGDVTSILRAIGRLAGGAIEANDLSRLMQCRAEL